MRNTKFRVYLAWALLAGTVIGWPLARNYVNKPGRAVHARYAGQDRMSGLDEKLKQVLDDAFADGPDGEVWLVEPVIERIKQAFIDAGYLPFQEYVDKNCITGQEWFSRFDKNFRNMNFPYKNKSEQCLIITLTEAAYKAAKKTSEVE